MILASATDIARIRALVSEYYAGSKLTYAQATDEKGGICFIVHTGRGPTKTRVRFKGKTRMVFETFEASSSETLFA